MQKGGSNSSDGTFVCVLVVLGALYVCVRAGEGRERGGMAALYL
jgi:hypothetical protein